MLLGILRCVRICVLRSGLWSYLFLWSLRWWRQELFAFALPGLSTWPGLSNEGMIWCQRWSFWVLGWYCRANVAECFYLIPILCSFWIFCDQSFLVDLANPEMKPSQSHHQTFSLFLLRADLHCFPREKSNLLICNVKTASNCGWFQIS